MSPDAEKLQTKDSTEASAPEQHGPSVRASANPAPTRTSARHTTQDVSDGEVLVEEVSRFIERFVFLKAKSVYRLIAMWTIATHMYSDFEYTSYLFAFSPEPQSGKSRLLEVLDVLVANSSGILVSPTEAVLFRTSEGHTQLIDEVDGWTNREFLRSVLNAGFHRGTRVKRAEEGTGGFKIASYPVFAPRALAGIGSKILDATTRDRTLMVEMLRQLPDERRAKFRARTVGPEAERLKTEIAKWVAYRRDQIVACYERGGFSLPSRFPRQDHRRFRTAGRCFGSGLRFEPWSRAS